ncbi:MAG: hypothetical protein JWM10_527 [Myxococcaceae bacterium]|nr:hypothetical protein [Myxococcaceae bacterium]
MPTRRSAPVAQLDLFKGAEPLAAVYREAAAVAERLPPTLHFGTSSWFSTGWEGIVWSRRYTESDLAHDGLSEYSRHPLLTTVGIDRSYYGPVPPADFDRYASQLPAGFRCVIKAPASVTSAIVPNRRDEVPIANPDYCSVERFMRDLGDALVGHFLPHTAAVLFEFPMAPRAFTGDASEFAHRLDGMLAEMDPRIPVAIELRDPGLLKTPYANVLRARRAAHTYNLHTHMPLPGLQRAVVALRDQPFAVVRLLMPPQTRYEERKREFAPFNRLQDVDEARRADTLSVIVEAIGGGLETWVLVNNKAEGSSPLTIKALAEALAG